MSLNYKALTFKDVKVTRVHDDKELYDVENLFQIEVDFVNVKMTSKCTKRSIVIMDNEKYNETYLKDLFNEWYEKLDASDKEKADNVDFYYVDDVKLRLLIMRPRFCYTTKEYTEEEKSTIEHQLISPTILSFNPNGVIGVIEEPKMGVITSDLIPDIFKFLHDDNIES